MYSTIPHAKMTLPRPEVHPKHPLRNAATHQALLDYIQPRLQVGVDARNGRIQRMIRADKSIAGWMRMSEDDRKAQRKEETDGIPRAITMNLPLSFVQIDDMMTYYSQTFAPNRGMFYQQGKPDEVTAASQIVTIMNNHAIYAGYYRQVLLTIFSILKYNQGGLCMEWGKDIGPKLVVDSEGKTVASDSVIWQGNRVEALDMYNTFWDPSVPCMEVYRQGEWFAKTKIVSHYWLQNKAMQGLYFNVKEALDNDEGVGTAKYYVSPPEETRMTSDHSTGNGGGGATNWVSFLGGAPGYASNSGFELTEMYIKLNPWQLNLIPNTRQNVNRDRYEMWRISLINDRHVVDCTPMNNIHGFLPCFMGVLNDDGMEGASKSVAEILKPLQDFASFLLNTHVQGTRKNIWGLTIYDPNMVDLAQIPDGEVNARVAAKPTAAGKDLNKGIWQHQGTVDTKQTMQDLESTMTIINQFFPTTSMPSQIASIDRAVDSQVAAVQQGANRRMQKGARLLDETMFRPLRFALYYNIIQFQPDGAEITDFYGKPQKIDLTQLRATDLPFIIGQGLKAIDRQAAASQMQSIIFALIQNPASAQQTDILAMIDYWTSMIDIDVDMKQFRMAPQQPGVDPATGQPALAAPQQGVVSATDPAAMTAPLAG